MKKMKTMKNRTSPLLSATLWVPLFLAMFGSNPSVFSQSLELNLGVGSLKIERESIEEETTLGRLVAAQLLGAARLLEDEKLQRYVNLVGRRVADQAGRPELTWSFGVIDSSAVNAFAAPAGKILLTSELMSILDSEDELAAVIAHEVAHVVRKHHYRVLRKQRMLEFGAQAVAIKDDLTGMSEKLSGMVAQVLARGLDQAAEYEADRDGMVYAARAGYDASALIRVMEKLAALSAKEPSGELLLSTHPSADARRIALARVVSAEIEKMAVESKSAARFKEFVR